MAPILVTFIKGRWSDDQRHSFVFFVIAFSLSGLQVGHSEVNVDEGL